MRCHDPPSKENIQICGKPYYEIPINWGKPKYKQKEKRLRQKTTCFTIIKGNIY